MNKDMTQYPEHGMDKFRYESTVYDQWYGSDGRLDRPFYYHNLKNERAFIKSLIAKHGIPTGSKLIDIGCGNGLYASLFAEHGIRVTAVDISERAINFAAAKYGAIVEWICGDAFALTYNEHFDYGFCNFFTFFNANELTTQSVEYGKKIMRYIRPGGVLYFIWYSDLTAIRLPANRFNIMNFTIKQLEALFADFSIDSYAIDSMARIPMYLGRFAYNKYITRLSCAAVMLLNSSWKRVRIILKVKKA
ncbi:MAG TPA: methyltransferase domain-containing protein [Planctomycetota bacterium]|jgi:SAM-dependent methyltransferase|nr:methyltransferase domain-containing protein [Planctomycetota bacterium]OQC21104.1 MAG: Cypemycin methyltransferase [Planctomycetes bacterium ADurb.Bin069]HNS00744.1 methyltransferase domain-containing protein [Planctomycetota bacterium]HNU27304.1 methyltransferase domain-containing protein [Planctomycetota bacterium]HOE31499.1 methyltransferase domain-containing protein [Planctomycetota bacterium]